MRAAAAWADTAQAGPEGLVARLAPHASEAVAWVLGHVGSVGGLLVHFLLVVILSAILYASGETAARIPSSWPGRPFGRSHWGSASRPSSRRCSEASAWPSPGFRRPAFCPR